MKLLAIIIIITKCWMCMTGCADHAVNVENQPSDQNKY